MYGGEKQKCLKIIMSSKNDKTGTIAQPEKSFDFALAENK